MRVLSIDAGTSAVKAAVVGRTGTIEAVEGRRLPRQGNAGIDPDAVWGVVVEATREVLRGVAAVDAVAVTGQGDGLWTLAAEGRPAGPAYEWNTSVAADVVRAWERDGTIVEHYRRSGTVLWPGTAAAIWNWLRTTCPEQAAATRHVFCAKDFVNYRLTGRVATDPGDGSIPFLDPGTRRYDEAALERLGCADLADLLAPVLPAGSRLGEVTGDAAAATGLLAGTPVLMASLDVVCLMYATGQTEPGTAVAVLGTTAAALAVTEAPIGTGEPVGAVVAMPEQGRNLAVLGATSGTTTLDWFLDLIGDRRPDRFDRFWDDVARARGGVLMLPYLAGERAPFLAPDATGTFIGISPSTGRAELARAVVTGVTFALRHCLEAAADDLSSVVLTGGGVASPGWCQLVSDVTGLPVSVDDRPHVACLGAAALATGDPALVGGARSALTPHRDYGAEYAQFLEAGRSMRPLWSRLHDRRGDDAGDGA